MTMRHRDSMRPRARSVHAAFLVALLCLAGRPVRAQTPPPPPPLHEGSADISFVGTSGNSSSDSLGLGGQFIHRPDP